MTDKYIKTSEEILQNLLNQVSDEYQKSVGFPMYDILNAFAIASEPIYITLERTAKELDADNLMGVFLDRFIGQRKGLIRKPATFATVSLTITGSGIIQKGDLFQTETGLIFEAVETKEINQTGQVLAKCTVSGAIGNVLVGEINIISVSIPGILGVTNEQKAEGGYDAEKDEDFRERYYKALREPATSGNVYHYEQWAKEVTGVGKVKVIPRHKGVNTVKLVIINSNNQPADQSLITDVQNYIDPNGRGEGRGKAPIGAECLVVSATSTTIDISVKIRGANDETTKSIIRKKVRDYFASVAFKEDYISYAKVANVILNTEGINDIENLKLNGKAENITVPELSVAVLGVMTFD